MCEQKCHVTVWVFRECLKSLYCPQCKRYMSCVCGLGFGGGSKILMEKKNTMCPGFWHMQSYWGETKPQKQKPARGRHRAACFSLSPLRPQDSMHCAGARPHSPTTEHQRQAPALTSPTTLLATHPSIAHQILVNKTGSLSEGGSYRPLRSSEGRSLCLASPLSIEKTDW